MKQRKCNSCGEVKEVSAFGKSSRNKSGLQSKCKACRKDYYTANADKIKAKTNKWYYDNLDKAKQSRKKWREDNKESLKKSKAEYYKANKDKYAYDADRYQEIKKTEWYKKAQEKYYTENKESILSYAKKYRQVEKNKERTKKWREKRYHTNPIIRAVRDSRSLINKSYTGKHARGGENANELLGCNAIEFRDYIDGQLKEGMTPENYGDVWNLDYIVPLGMCETLEEVFIYTHYSNIQPMFVYENLSKKDNYIG